VAVAERALLRLAGGLLVGGFAANLVATHLHPAGRDDDHPAIFAKYARNDGWLAVHAVQFAAILLVLAGFVALYRIVQLSGEVPVLALCALGATVATAATWAVLQGVDGVALKQAVDAWASASGPEKAVRFADAETVRWIEWGVNAFFRLLLGLTLALYGTVIARTAFIPRWLGWVGVAGGLLYMATGIAVGSAGFKSGFGDAVGIPVQLLFVVFVIGVLVTGVRRREAR
jgi:rhodanese-related sulfurtransferase